MVLLEAFQLFCFHRLLTSMKTVGEEWQTSPFYESRNKVHVSGETNKFIDLKHEFIFLDQGCQANGSFSNLDRK